MAKTKRTKADLSRPLTDDERAALEEMRGIQASIEAQESVVRSMKKKLAAESRQLRELANKLLTAGRKLPLFEDRP